jgi:hypothetical protein
VCVPYQPNVFASSNGLDNSSDNVFLAFVNCRLPGEGIEVPSCCCPASAVLAIDCRRIHLAMV